MAPKLTRHLRGTPPYGEKQPIEGYSREFADDTQRDFLAERSTALDIAPPTAIDTQKVGKRLLAPRPLKPIASRKRRARFDTSVPGKLGAIHDVAPHDKIQGLKPWRF